jgi:tRNA G18 (ribose-2'-O)-methylase SpoU
MPVVQIHDLGDPRLADYRHVPDPELLRRGEVFVAEGRLVVRTLLARSPFATRSVLVTETALDALRDVIEPRLVELPVYVVEQGGIEALTGFNIHRGCLAIGERPKATGLGPLLREVHGDARGAWLEPARRHLASRSTGPLVVLEQIVNADNVGGIFRNAAAFGAAAVVLGPNCCDPLYRKSIRTSMGAVLRVPFAGADEWPGALGRLRDAGFTVVALTPRPDAVSIEDFVRTRVAPGVPVGSVSPSHRVALLAGSEGPGLSAEATAAADVAVRIPMATGQDSLNVATAVGIALYRLAAHQGPGARIQA